MKSKIVEAFNNCRKEKRSALITYVVAGDNSKKNSIRIIVQKKNIVMGKKEDDITKDILELINQKVKSIKID